MPPEAVNNGKPEPAGKRGMEMRGRKGTEGKERIGKGNGRERTGGKGKGREGKKRKNEPRAGFKEGINYPYRYFLLCWHFLLNAFLLY
jgi:hypothetical protein